MSADSFVSATGTLVGVGTTLMTAVATHVGPLSAQSLTNRGAAMMDNAQAVLNRKVPRRDVEERGREQFIIPDALRREFLENEINTLHAERDRLLKVTQTFRGSITNWNSARAFCQGAGTSFYGAEALSSRSWTRLMLQEATPEDGQDENDSSDSERTQLEGSHPAAPASGTQAYSQMSYEQDANGGYPPANHSSRHHSIASSQQSFSTARAGSLDQYTSGTLYQSPASIEGPSFANFQGDSFANAEFSAHKNFHLSAPGPKANKFSAPNRK